MIAYSRSENLRDSLVKAKLPTREKNDYTYDDLVTNEEDPTSSATLHTLQDLDLGIRGFNMFIDFEEIEEDQNTQGPTPSNRKKTWKIIPHIRSRHIRMEKHTRQIWTVIYVLKHYNHDNGGLHPQEHIITKG